MTKVIVYVVIMCIWYLGVWVGLTLWMIHIKLKAREFGRAYEIDQPMVFLILFIWPITAIPWFLWRLVKLASNKMEEVTQGGIIMSRLIDADALEAEFAGMPPDWYSTGTILRSIAAAPTIDAVPVVRCSECRYGTVSTTTPMTICNHPNGLVAPRWGSWCSYGKRKEDDHE